MKTNLYLSGGRLLVAVEGRLVLDECEPFKKAVTSALSPAVAHVLVDLSKTEFVDSSGLGALVGIKIKSNQMKARMTLINPSPQVSDIMIMSKLNEVFEIATGAEANALAGQLASPDNLLRTLAPGSASGVAAPASPDSLRIGESRPRSRDTETEEAVQDLCRKAAEALGRGQYEEAVRFYREAIAKNSSYLPAHNNLAIVYEKRPEWRQRAIEEWEIVLRLSEQVGDTKDKERAERHLQALRG